MPSSDTYFKPGHKFGKGRKKGSKNKLTSAWLKALKDDFDAKSTISQEITIEPIEVNTKRNIDLKKIFQNQTQNEEINPINPIRLKNLLQKEISDAYWNLFQMHKHMGTNHPETAFQMGREIIKKFTTSFYSNFCKEFPEFKPKFGNFGKLINHLYSIKCFPLANTEMQNYLDVTENFKEGGYQENHNIVEKLYKHNSEFFHKLIVFIEANES